MVVVAVVQLPSHVQLFATPWTAACQASLSLTIPWSLPKFTSIESVMPSNCLILCHPHPPAFSLSQHQGLSNKLAVHIGWPKYWSFSFSISPSNEYSGLIFFLGLTGLISSLSSGVSRVFSNTTVQKHPFFCAQPSVWSDAHIHT